MIDYPRVAGVGGCARVRAQRTRWPTRPIRARAWCAHVRVNGQVRTRVCPYHSGDWANQRQRPIDEIKTR